MSIRRLLLTISLLILPANFALAQSEQAAQTQTTSAPVITASATAGGVRFASPGQVSQIRLEIYSASGELVYDSGLRGGGIIDWKTADAAQVLADGRYMSVVTIKNFQGRLRQRLGALAVHGGQVTPQGARKDDLTAAQSQALDASRQAQNISTTADNALTIVGEGDAQAATVTTHDGKDGQVTSTTGALTFATGDVLSAKDKEQMRITPEGRVGIGTDKPEATLDVAGTIRARGGIRFDDGTVLTSASNVIGSGVAVVNGAAGGEMQTNAIGAGTANKLSKWIDAAGTLGDSVITESGGKVGIGNTNPSTTLDVIGGFTLRNSAASGGFRIADRSTDQGRQMVFAATTGAPYSVFNTFVQGSTLAAPRLAQFSAWTSDIEADAGNSSQFLFRHDPAFGGLIGTIGYGTGTANKISIQANYAEGTTPTALVVDTNGKVGVGTATPTERLDVAGNLKITGGGFGILFPDGSVLTSATGAGGSPSGTSLVSTINAAGTVGTINDNRLAANVARTNGANAWSGANVFGAGLSANNALVTNVGNPVNAGDAVNKAYADSNFVKFVPGAEQLSVGDANGTATMINLRGGSTCCSGPGGHTPAFFKVFQNGSFVATGNLGIGTSPMEGKGYRTSWHTYKGAFRSGYADNEWDDANVGFFSWAGGSNSTASGLYALAFGDTNSAESTSSIVFGSGNQVKGAAGFSAGAGNRVCDTYGVALGNNAKSGGPYINGKCDPETFNIRGLAAVAIGYNVTADQDHTMALGKFASNNGFQGTFIWSDGAPQATADTFRNTANNEFAARATGGFRFRTNLGGTTGCNLPAGSGVFNCTSSRATKENFTGVDGNDVLARLRKVPVSTWNYIAEGKESRHLGPMAEDFYSAFRLGTTDKAIGIQDAVGVSLAAVKALDARTLELQQKTEEVEQLRTRVNTLEQRLAALEQLVGAGKAEAKPETNQQR
ncbi:MAG TPA: tail fiber domain-containing protein [Pyrinomonadaceae bacterium]|nr:tail fiber domain-containing protein [Pyrinomonadaceae bacterium]